ncbi:MAG: M23 family metallopeptidase [Deltaproteobacteria bacterium]|nr:M23 family metallopeptidase [Deltaproteobacteria bacterium]
MRAKSFPEIPFLPIILAIAGCYDGFGDYRVQETEDGSNAGMVCSPGDVKECPCPGGTKGTQTCADDGLRWAKCEGCQESGEDTFNSDSGSEPSEDSGMDAGSPDADSADAGSPDAGPADANFTDAGMDGGIADPPTPRAPCEIGRCWLNAPALGGRCGTSTVRENFETGLYNVHRYPLAAPAGVSVDVTLDVTGGNWNPALIVLAIDGTTLYDGERALTGNPVKTEALASGKAGTPAKVRITAQGETPLHVFVTSWNVVDDGFAPAMPTDATYTLTAFADCPVPDATCPMDPNSITSFGSGYFTPSDSDDPNSPNYNPYKRDDRTSHHGYDLLAALGTPVFATENGTIVSSETSDVGYCGMDTNLPGLCGRSINLAADSGVTFRYCHLDKVLVTSGYVQAGQLTGENGDSGNACAPHVHFAYLDAPNVTGAGTDAQKSEKVNAYVDSLCR